MRKRIVSRSHTGIFSVPPLVNSSWMTLRPSFHPTKSTTSRPPMSIRTLAEVKSNRSKMFLPNTFQSARTPCDKEQRPPSTQRTTRHSATAALRLRWNSSMQKATMTSSTEMDEVRAASSKARKKKMATMPPAGSWLKIYGSVVKTRPGPSPGLMPKAKTAGMMAQPAISANSVSATAVSVPILTIFSFLDT